MTTLASLPHRTVRLLSVKGRFRPREAPPTGDPLDDGAAWARAYLMRDGTVMVEGRRGAAVLDGELGAQVQGVFRIAGIRERPR
ncbi:MAG: hypothetical protein IPP91_11065 [Betaproteobacteria bacterium]|nr:hypothetical protein [Betaproteobacteria bacterium]